MVVLTRVCLKKCVHTNVSKYVRVRFRLLHLNVQNYELGFTLTPFQAYTRKGDCRGFPWWLFIALCHYCFVFYLPGLSVLDLVCILLHIVLKALLCAVCIVTFAKHKLFLCSILLQRAVHCVLEQKLLSLWFLFLVLPIIFTFHSVEIEVCDCVYKVWFICY